MPLNRLKNHEYRSFENSFHINYYVLLDRNLISLIKNKHSIVENFALIFTAIIVGIIVSIVAQLLIIAAKNIFQFLFLNDSFSLRANIFGFDLNLLPFLICIPASLLVGLLLNILA